MKRYWLIFLLGLFCNSAGAQNELKIITLHHRFAQDILPVIQPMAGENGAASAVDNHLLIRAAPERMEAIEEMVAKLDTERRNLRITINHGDVVQSKQGHIGLAGSAGTDNVRIDVNKSRFPRNMRNGVVINAQEGSQEFHRQGSEFLTVLDGSQAFIRVGQSVPYTQQWVMLTRRYLHVQQATEFRDITTGFAVRPRVIGDQIELEITPRIATAVHAGFMDFEELSTTVRVTPGQWLDLGAAMQGRDEVSQLILERETFLEEKNGRLMVKVD